MSMTSSSSVESQQQSQGFLNQASKLFSSALGTGSKKKVDVPKVLSKAAVAAKKVGSLYLSQERDSTGGQQQEEEEKKLARLQDMELRRKMAAMKKAQEEKAKQAEEERKKKEEAERRKRERDEAAEKLRTVKHTPSKRVRCVLPFSSDAFLTSRSRRMSLRRSQSNLTENHLGSRRRHPTQT